MKLIAIDPGPKTSGVVLYDGERCLMASSAMPNDDVLDLLREADGPVVIEWLSNQGAHVGQSTFRTAWWIGRFSEACRERGRVEIMRTRHDVLWALFGCRPKKADQAVMHAMLDRFGEGERKVAVGTKGAPGPCYGVSGHAWQALALAVVTWEALESAQSVMQGGEARA